MTIPDAELLSALAALVTALAALICAVRERR